MKRWRRILVLVVLIGVPISIWTFIKPVRILVPTLAGFSCVEDRVFIDDGRKGPEAARLYSEAMEYVSTRLGPLKRPPKVIFCTTKESLAKFGLDKQAGHTFGPFGIVIAPRGWKPFYLRHEMIHHLQLEHLGIFKCRRLPQWFIEGMAYTLSEDPRETLSEPWQGYRSTFEKWYGSLDRDTLWQRAADLR